MELDWAYSRGWSWVHSRLFAILIFLLSIALVLLAIFLLLVALVLLVAIILLLITVIVLLTFSWIVFGRFILEKTIVHSIVVIAWLLSPLVLITLSKAKLRTVLFGSVHLASKTVFVVLSWTLWWPEDLLLLWSIWLSFPSTSSALTWPICLWFIISEDIYACPTARRMMHFDRSLLLFITISVVILILRCPHLVLDLVSKLAVLIVALRLPIPRTLTLHVIVSLRHVGSITILIELLILSSIICLLGLDLLFFLAISPSNGPLTSTTWLMVDFNASLIVFWVVMLVHLWLPSVLGSLHFFLGRLIGSVKFAISSFWWVLVHFKNQMIFLTTL